MKSITLRSKCLIVAGSALLLGTGQLSAADYNSNFNGSLGHFSKAAFTFNGEKGMDVSYRKQNAYFNSGKLVLWSQKTSGNDATGAWVQTSHLFPQGSNVRSNCRLTGNATARSRAWGAFWTLYDQVLSTGNSNEYYEIDIFETEPRGNYFNRYIQKNTDNEVVTAGGAKLMPDSYSWRNGYRTYFASWSANAAYIAAWGSGGANHTHSNGWRGGKVQRMIVQNRPWGPILNQMGNNQYVADARFDFANGQTP